MSKHTPEPWRQGGSESDAVSKFAHASQVVGELDGSTYILASFNYNFPELAIANAGRAVACVNAMAGIADPAAFVERAKRIEEAARDLIGCWQDDISPLTNPIERLITALETNP